MKKLQRTVFGIVLSLMAGMCPAVWAQSAEKGGMCEVRKETASCKQDVLCANNGGRTTPNAGTNAVVSATPPTCAAETSDAVTNAVPSGASFYIPPPLRVRMEAAYNAERDKRLSLTDRIDVYEFIGLNKGGVFTNALEIAKRPRGEMAFCDGMAIFQGGEFCLRVSEQKVHVNFLYGEKHG